MKFVKGIFYEHEGGTKFYELTMFRGDDNFFYVVRRWGKIDVAVGGGQIKIGKFRSGGADSDYYKEDSARSKRGYKVTKNIELGGPAPGDTALNVARRMGVKNATALADAMGGEIDVAGEVNEVVEEAPAPPPPPIDRGEEWASW